MSKKYGIIVTVMLACVGGAVLMGLSETASQNHSLMADGTKAGAEMKSAGVEKAMDVPGMSAAADFKLVDVDGKMHSLSSYRGKYVVLEWFNPNCPFVKKFYNSGKMQELQKTYTDRGVIWLTISSTNPKHQDYYDAAALKKKCADWKSAATAMLRDDSGEVGKQYRAKTTPHMFIINPDGKLIYDGAIDSIRSANTDDIAKADNYVAKILDAALLTAKEPYGCSVKY